MTQRSTKATIAIWTLLTAAAVSIYNLGVTNFPKILAFLAEAEEPAMTFPVIPWSWLGVIAVAGLFLFLVAISVDQIANIRSRNRL